MHFLLHFFKVLCLIISNTMWIIYCVMKVASSDNHKGQASLMWWSFYWLICNMFAPLKLQWEALYRLAVWPWADVEGICPFWPRIGLSDPLRPQHPHPESATDVWYVCYLQSEADAPSATTTHCSQRETSRPFDVVCVSVRDVKHLDSELIWRCD